MCLFVCQAPYKSYHDVAIYIWSWNHTVKAMTIGFE